MHKRKFTVFTQLHEENNADLIEYFDDFKTNMGLLVEPQIPLFQTHKVD